MESEHIVGRKAKGSPACIFQATVRTCALLKASGFVGKRNLVASSGVIWSDSGFLTRRSQGICPAPNGEALVSRKAQAPLYHSSPDCSRNLSYWKSRVVSAGANREAEKSSTPALRQGHLSTVARA